MPPPTRMKSAASEPPKPNPISTFIAFSWKDQKDDGRAEQSEADREHARDAAGFERDFHRVLEAGERGVGAAHVALDRQFHSDQARAVGGADAHQEGDGDSERQGEVVRDKPGDT